MAKATRKTSKNSSSKKSTVKAKKAAKKSSSSYKEGKGNADGYVPKPPVSKDKK